MNIISVRKTGAEIQIFVNGVSQGSGTASDVVNFAANPVSVVIGGDGTSHFEGYIGELLLWSDGLSDDELICVHTQLAKTWELCDTTGIICDAVLTDGNCFEPDPVCGNGVVEADEQCDDGGLVNLDGCDSNCVFEVCGNGVVQPESNEACDDGNSVSGDGCDSNCQWEIYLGNFTADSTSPGPLDSCNRQARCIDWGVTKRPKGGLCTGECEWKVCLTLRLDYSWCPKTKDETLSHTCEPSSDSCDSTTTTFDSGASVEVLDIGGEPPFAYSQCLFANGNTTVHFLLKDGAGDPSRLLLPGLLTLMRALALTDVRWRCPPTPARPRCALAGCNPAEEFSTVDVGTSGSLGCQPRPDSIGSCTGNRPGAECVWSFTTPICGDEPPPPGPVVGNWTPPVASPVPEDNTTDYIDNPNFTLGEPTCPVIPFHHKCDGNCHVLPSPSPACP